MPTFHDIRIASTLTNSLSRGTFAEYIERETGYSSDGTLEQRAALIALCPMPEMTPREQYILDIESRLIPVLAEMEMR